MSVEERLLKVQYRSQQAESALKQLETCIEIINSKRNGPPALDKDVDVIRQLEEENRMLKQEAADLKERLIQLEFLNGVEQVPYRVPVTSDQPLEFSPPKSNQEEQSLKPTTPPQEKQTGKKEKQPKAKEKQPKPPSSGAGAQGKPVDVSRLDMRIGRILSVKKHPDADTLYVEEINVGEDTPRTVCSGLVNNIPIDQMENRMVVAMCNLKPVKMRGVVSQAMVMCASTPDEVEILDPPANAVPGDRVSVEGYPGAPDEILNPKKKIFEQVQPDLLTNAEGVACYKGVPWMIPGKGVMKSQTMKNSPIK